MSLDPDRHKKTASSISLILLAGILLTGCSSPGGGERTTDTATLPALDTASTVVAAVEAAATQTESLPPTSTPAEQASATARSETPSPVLATNTPTGQEDGANAQLTLTAEAQGAITTTVEISPTLSNPITETVGTQASDPYAINGLPTDSIIVTSDAVNEHVREIFARGQALGRNAHAFSKLGDSLIATPSFLTRFDTGNYNLGDYDYLQPTIDYYAGSYERYGVALRPGLHAWGVFDPLWANKEWCQANEDLLTCEFRLNNPSVVLILLGTNDAGNPPGFDFNMRKVVEFAIDNGVIPVIATKADRFEGPENTNNNIMRQIAADYAIPLWDFDLVAETIPGRGLTEDQVHLSVFVENDYTMVEAYQTGHGVHNLTALMVLDSIRQAIE